MTALGLVSVRRETGMEQGVVHRPSYRAAKMTSSRAPTLLTLWKATRMGTPARVPIRPGAVEELGMCRRSLHGNREISRSANSVVLCAALARIGKARSRSR